MFEWPIRKLKRIVYSCKVKVMYIKISNKKKIIEFLFGT